METVQNILFASTAGVLACLLIWGRAHRVFPCLLIYCIAGIPYALTSSTFGYAGDCVFVGLRMAMVLEAGWRALGEKRWESRLMLSVFVLCLAAAALVPSGAETKIAYIPIRHLIFSGLFVVLLILVGVDLLFTLTSVIVVRWHLRLLCLWMLAQSATSLSYDFYDSMSAWLRTRWSYWAVFGAIVVGYGKILHDQRKRLS